VYWKVSYSTFGLESEAKLQTRVICLFFALRGHWSSSQTGVAASYAP
jgi:hypothetical protein